LQVYLAICIWILFVVLYCPLWNLIFLLNKFYLFVGFKKRNIITFTLIFILNLYIVIFINFIIIIVGNKFCWKKVFLGIFLRQWFYRYHTQTVLVVLLSVIDYFKNRIVLFSNIFSNFCIKMGWQVIILLYRIEV